MNHSPLSFSLSRKLTRWRCLLTSLVLLGTWLHRQTLLKFPIDVKDDTSFASPSLGVSTFSGNKTRTFQGRLQFASDGQWSFLRNRFGKKSTVREFPRFVPNCDRWVVVMLGANDHGKDPESSLVLLKSWTGWCTIVIMDDEGYSYHDALKQKYESDKMIFLSVAQQHAEIPHPFVQRVLLSLTKEDGANRRIRKNIGYLFAIRHGANAIFDFELSGHQGIRENWLPFGSSFTSRVRVRYTKNHHKDKNSLPIFNPLPYLVSKFNIHKRLFPRGFPGNATILEDNEEPLPSYDFGSVKYSSVGVVHSVSCEDVWGDDDGDEPDTMLFDSEPKTSSRILIPAEHFTPYSANSTAFLHQAFWGLLLPSTVPCEMADIWRAYIVQPLLYELQLAVISESTTEHTDVLAKKNRISMFDSDEARALEKKLSSLLQFLASESSTGRYDSSSSSSYLPARMERLAVELYERGFVGLDDVYATQEWLLALRDVGYDFPVKKVEQTKLVHAEPSLENQPYLASPAFNVGKNGRRYMDHLRRSKRPGSLDLYNEWLQQLKIERRNDDGVIVKLVTMTKNEWPLTKDWIWYHGELVGFENIYLLDGSSDPKSIAFLVHARDYLGVNVIFSSAGLNQLEEELSKVGREISKASDFVLKMDVDEFLVAHKEAQACIHSTDRNSKGASTVDCSLSPYAVLDTINDFRRIATGERLKVGYRMESQPNLAACSLDDTKNDIGSFSLGRIESVDVFKTISDSRTLAGLDLGGHKNYFVAPFGASKQVGNRTDLGILHFHSRCLDTEVSNSRKVLLSHNFIKENDTEEVAKTKLMEQYGIKGDEVDLCKVTKMEGASWHKALFYLQYLHGCISNDTFYGSAEKTSFNPDFQKFLNDARERHRRFDLE